MWIIIILVIAVIIFIIYKNMKNLNINKNSTSEVKVYTESDLKKMSLKEVDSLYDSAYSVVAANKDKSDSEELPDGSTLCGCKTWGETRKFLNLLDKISCIKNIETIMNDKNDFIEMPGITAEEFTLIEELGETDAVLAAYETAKNGDTKGMVFLGTLYALKLNIPEMAFYWMKKATFEGNIDAEYLLATYYMSGYGIDADTQIGSQLMVNAASRGYEDAVLYCNEKLKISDSLLKNSVY